MTSKDRCFRCGKEIEEVRHCDNCYNEAWKLYMEMMEKYQQLKQILKGIMEIARVVEE